MSLVVALYITYNQQLQDEKFEEKKEKKCNVWATNPARKFVFAYLLDGV
jgi:hypothetical protein